MKTDLTWRDAALAAPTHPALRWTLPTAPAQHRRATATATACGLSGHLELVEHPGDLPRCIGCYRASHKKGR